LFAKWDNMTDNISARLDAPFAVLYRQGAGVVEVLTGPVSTHERVADLPVPTGPPPAGGCHDVLALLPYRQLAERGYDCVDDGTPLLALRVSEQVRVPVAEFLAEVPDVPVELAGGGFDIDDADYAELVRGVIDEEIGAGTGANFVLKRSFLATLPDFGPAAALALFCRLLRGERGTYWTFLVHTGDRMLLGASPEKHVSLERGTVTMNPISGTFRRPPATASLADVLGFLGDTKETEELSMVLDEELKMMGQLCWDGGRVHGPGWKSMARLAHTEYLITGSSTLDPREILATTMYAPTVTGSPLESACRVIARRERTGRGYYAGAIALFGRDADGTSRLDSTIAIRTAQIDDLDSGAPRLRLDVGATVVRHSNPAAEAAETAAKAAGMLAAFAGETAATPAEPARDVLNRVAGSAAAEPAGEVAGGVAGGAAGQLASEAVGHVASGVAGEVAGGAVSGAVGGVAGGAVGGVAGGAGGGVPGEVAGGVAGETQWAEHPRVRAALRARTAGLGEFWLGGRAGREGEQAAFGRRALVVDCEDTFTAMLRHQLAALGLAVDVVRFDERVLTHGYDLVVAGPGPGDPRDHGHPKIAVMRGLVDRVLAAGQPLMAVCLGHQVLSTVLGLDVVRRAVPNQGVAREIELFGRTERCGFYNTFAARADGDLVSTPHGLIDVCRDADTREIHAMRGERLYSMQFHPESVLTRNGVGILRDVVTELLPTEALTG
jgi:2-amino-4-deoxychorismate synthase